MTQALPSKKDVALAFLERSTVRIFLDPRKNGVVVPPWFKNQPQLLLDVGLNTAIAIPDLHLDDDALSCTLSFNRSPFYCVLPWSAVFALVGDEERAVVWPDDVPPEVQLESKAPPKRPMAIVPEPEVPVTKGPKAVPSPKNRKKAPAAAPAPAPAPTTAIVGANKAPKKRPPLTGLPAAKESQPKAKRELPSYLRIIK
jgi:stringent starvation protein B